jgi:hypothetical protein
MKFPDIAACAALMEEHGMLANIREHSFVVARVAALLAEEWAKPAASRLIFSSASAARSCMTLPKPPA